MGLALGVMSIWVPPLLLLVLGIVVFQSGHNLAPMALAWWHRGFRAYALARPVKFIAVPLTILAATTLAGIAGGLWWPPLRFNPATLKIDDAALSHPLWALGLVYGYWNIYHFGKQNFGVMSIYRRKAGGYVPAQRRRDMIFSCTTAWSMMAISVFIAANYLLRHWYSIHHQSLGPTEASAVYWASWAINYPQVRTAYVAAAAVAAALMMTWEWRRVGRPPASRVALIATNGIGMGTALVWPVLALGIVSMNHWLTAIGLAGHTLRRPWLFPVVAIVAGVALFCALFPDLLHFRLPTRVAAWAIGFRLGMGIVHFLYDRWVWRLSDPQVRKLIWPTGVLDA